MSTTFDFTKIKSIYLPIHEYKFDHGPTNKDQPNPNFIGREEILEKLCLLLDTVYRPLINANKNNYKIFVNIVKLENGNSEKTRQKELKLQDRHCLGAT